MPTLQAQGFAAGYTCQASLPGLQGLGSCSYTQVWFLPGGPPTVEIKVGMEWGKRKGRKALNLCCPGAGASPLWRARGKRWKLQGLAFLTGFILIFIIFSVFP